MKAQEYLKARGIQIIQLESTSVGRLSIEAEFKLGGKRGVVVSPKRGSISDRYLSLLYDEEVSFVLVEGGSILSFYESSQKGDGLLSARALRPDKSKLFPSQELFEYLTMLLWHSVKRPELNDVAISKLLVTRIEDEKSGKGDEWTCSVNGTTDDCSAIISRITGKLNAVDVNPEGILRLSAVLAGFRMTPSTPDESARLIDWIARAIDNKKSFHGLPLVLSPAFMAIGEKAASTTLVTSTVGAQFSVLSGANSEEVFLENGSHEILSLLQVLYPETTFTDDDYIESTSFRKKDAVVLIPPFGRSVQLKKETAITSSFFKHNPASKKYPAEYLYIIKAIDQCKPDGLITVVLPEGILSGASHKAFRDWLLDTVQILGVVSFPTGFCFSGTGIRCSVLFMKKAKQLPADYSISMIELRQEDFESDAIAGTIETIKAVFKPEDRA